MRAEQITEPAAHHGRRAVMGLGRGFALEDADSSVHLVLRHVTVFGGESLTELFVSPSHDGLEAGEDPVAGNPIRELAR